MSATDVWSLGDYGPLAARLAPAGRHAVDALETAEPVAGRDVLDVAAGDGAAARDLAARGARVVAVDSSPAMVARGRAATAGLAVDWREGDALALPVADASVDAAVSSFGVMFAPDPARAVAELGRVLRPGGRVAITAWSAEGFMGRMGRLMASFTGAAVGDLDAWSRDDGIGAWCAAAGLGDVVVTPAALPWQFPDGPAMTAFVAEHSPLHVASAAAAGARAPEMFAALERLAAPDGGPVDLDAAYVLVTARRTTDNATDTTTDKATDNTTGKEPR